MVNLKNLTAIAAAFLMLSVVGCGDKAGVDAEQVTEGGPRKTRKIGPEERVQITMKWLEEAEPDSATNQKMPMQFAALVVQGATAEPALPLLEKIKEEWDDDNVRNSAALAIEKIQAAVDEQNQQ